MNEKIIKNMMQCDGTRENCKGCVFEDHPACRNAMAHHAGALIQMQDTIITNQAYIIMAKKGQVEELEAKIKKEEEKTKKVYELLARLLKELKEKKVCDMCEYKEKGGEICHQCKKAEEESGFAIAKRTEEKEEDTEAV